MKTTLHPTRTTRIPASSPSRPSLLMRLAASLCLAAIAPAGRAAEPAPGPDAEGVAFFESRIRPVLVAHCHQCHAADSKSIRAGLLVDTRESIRAGGDSGQPGVVPGDPAASGVFVAITSTDPETRMPPKGPLPEHVIADFRTWIALGAADPREAGGTRPAAPRHEVDVAAGREHWSFRKPVAAAVPAVRNTDWPRGDIDRFLLAGMEAAGVAPVADADRPTLIRRLSFDLTGLPPTPEEVHDFVADTSATAVESLVDRLLASPRYGERFARHWLDVARDAESNGKESNFPYPHAWRYRDWVIAAFRDDKPYDLFLQEQLAGDLLRADGPRDQAEKIIATGFLALGPKGLNDQNPRQFHMDLVDEQIDVVSQAMLGLTLACARCHDHKFDPVSQRDYYALAGIFLSTETLYGTYAQQQNLRPSTLIELDAAAGQPAAVSPLEPADLERLRREFTALDEAAMDLERDAMAERRAGTDAQPAAFLRVRAARDRVSGARSDLDLFQPDGSPRTLAMGVLDRRQPRDGQLLARGEVDQPGEVVPRGLVEVLCAADEPRKIASGSGRLDLAFWIASPENPLTARVMANRVWLKLMGQGIVATPDNFGVMGMKPTHPELLDHLALALVADGWSVKKLVRRIVLSRAYQLASVHDAGNHTIDPDNRLRWRMDRRRLDAEAIRDAMLAVSGTLEERPPVGSPVARIREDRQGVIRLLTEMRSRRALERSIYLPIVRDQVPDFLNLFDFPDASLVSGQRDTTNVPSQGLFLLNNPEAIELAAAFARRVEALPGTPAERLARAHEMALGRPPTAEEQEAMMRFWTGFQHRPQAEAAGSGDRTAADRGRNERLTGLAVCQALFASAEFRHVH
ncbi:MAG: PSD1 and planctomycete cytochrome C domain-containing protein [Planctomycetia bacterium]